MQSMSLSTPKCVVPCSQASLPTLEKIPSSISMKPQSPTATVHTRTKLRQRWEEYQGVDNWRGLLDPLDETLRREIIRYGNFVEAAYASCNFVDAASCRFPKSTLLSQAGFPGTGYRVTRNLTATSGIQLPWMGTQSSWIGYVAVCHDRKEISRLGRRDVVIALRGTATALEWLENMRAALTPLSHGDAPMVESGFLSLYTSASGARPSLQTLIRDEISKIMHKYAHEPLSLTITGHSLGAALATLAAYDIRNTFPHAPLVTVVSFAGPRVGNWTFRCRLEDQGTKVLRIVNSDDLITKVPGFVIDNNHFCSPGHAAAAAWLRKLVEDMQWVYADVGCELRLSSRHAPGLNAINIAACHELKTYLHLVSNCPFRATARKIITQNTLLHPS